MSSSRSTDDAAPGSSNGHGRVHHRDRLLESVDHDEVDGWLRTYRRDGDRRLRNRAVEAMMPLVDLLARRYRRQEAAFEDLRQVALLAVVRAADRFDPDRGVHFSTFASRTIEGELKRYHRDRTWIVRPPRSLQELYLDVRSTEEALAHRNGRSPTVHEIADELGESVDHVLEALHASAVRSRMVLDDGPAPTDASERATPRASAVCIEGGYADVEREVVIAELLAKLPQREQDLVRMRFFENRSQQDIADRLGVTQSYLSRLLRHTLANLEARLDGAMSAVEHASPEAEHAPPPVDLPVPPAIEPPLRPAS